MIPPTTKPTPPPARPGPHIPLRVTVHLSEREVRALEYVVREGLIAADASGFFRSVAPYAESAVEKILAQYFPVPH